MAEVVYDTQSALRYDECLLFRGRLAHSARVYVYMPYIFTVVAFV